ncbi:unnamed protein product [Ostreobium quekettii]|uniref:Uncharacterized protein n=1 Tax=Ostreobium quekettii TaxID=121088 RepID=A0A8S1IXK3_9CHLO|nr:unnamed protein product [Ostreobium quekettii]
MKDGRWIKQQEGFLIAQRFASIQGIAMSEIQTLNVRLVYSIFHVTSIDRSVGSPDRAVMVSSVFSWGCVQVWMVPNTCAVAVRPDKGCGPCKTRAHFHARVRGGDSKLAVLRGVALLFCIRKDGALDYWGDWVLKLREWCKLPCIAFKVIGRFCLAGDV